MLEGIIRHLDRSSIRPVILCLRSRATDGNDETFASMGVGLHYLDCSLWTLELCNGAVARRVETLVRKVGADIIHTHGYHPDLIGASLSTNVPLISTQHNISIEDYVYAKGRTLGKYMHRRLTQTLRRFGTIVGITDAVSQYIRGLGISVETRTILNGVDTACFTTHSPEIRTAIRTELGIDPNAYTWIMCGSLSQRKDPLLVISAFISLLGSGGIPADSHLILVGKGPLLEECQALARGLEHRIHLMGFRPDAERYMSASDCLITASHSEGFGLNVAEALSSARAIIASDLPVFKELFAICPSEAIHTFPCGDHHALCRAMQASLGQTLSEANAEVYRMELSAERMSLRYAELYQELAQR